MSDVHRRLPQHRSPWTYSPYGTPGLNAFQNGNPKSRGEGQDKNKPKDDVRKTPCLVCGKRDCWYSEANLKPKGKGKDGKGKGSAGTQQQPSSKGKKGVKCWNCDAHTDIPPRIVRRKKQSLSAVENPTQSPSVSSVASGETMLSGFDLTSLILNCPGNWHR